MILPSEVEEVVDVKTFIPALDAWFWDEMASLYGVPSVPGHGLLMGFPLWSQMRDDGTLDEDFIDRFFFFCLPSLMATENRAVLQGNCRLVVYTNSASFRRFREMAVRLEQLGIEVVLRLIPPHIMEEIPRRPLNKYWVLGTVQQILVQMAGRAGMGFHMLMPDHLYGENYFKNLFRLAAQGYEGLAQTGISADAAGVMPELEKWREADGALRIPDRDLGTLGWRHLHKQIAYNVMNGHSLKTELPLSHYLAWRGKDRLFMYCCHHNAAYLSPRMCQRAPIRLHNALDTELPYYMPEKVGMVEAQDGMGFIEISDDKKLHSTERVPFSHFAAQAWATVHFKDDYNIFFSQPNTMFIDEQADGMDEADIRKEHATLVAALANCKDKIKEAFDRADAEYKRVKEAKAAEMPAELAAD